MADVIQQVRAEVNEAIGGRMDMLNSINTALQNVSGRQLTLSRIESVTSSQEIGKAATKKGEFRSFTSDLHPWMQAW